jgi:FKBP-type peptidyl-prolyl cis-trans isomerase FkpA
MNNLTRILKICMLFFAVSAVFSSCKKDEDTTPPVVYSAEKEAEQIKGWLDYVIGNGNNIDTTSTGLYYIVQKVGFGAKVATGDTVTVKYIGFFLSGIVFDSSLNTRDSTFTFVHKDINPKKRLIPGWEEGIEMLSKGSKAIMMIPSEKGYGTGGYLTIPPYTPLLFQIEIINIK